jgi:hypothetical protein
MRFLRIALCVAFLPLAGIRADDDSKDEEKQAPEEIPNFSQLDEYIYVPKSTMSLGERFFLHGPKTNYSGQGINPSTVDPGDLASTNVPNISRTYIDGTVGPDSRSVTVNSGLGGQITQPIQSDGRTDTWSYDNSGQTAGIPSQIQPNGNIAFHTYSSEITDTGDHETTGKSNVGLELILDRDMGKIGKHLKWSFTTGFAISDIHSSIYANVPTTITTLTDTYDLFGQVVPAAPYSSPTVGTQTVYGSNGQPVVGTTQATQTQSVSQVILLGNQPIGGSAGRSYSYDATDTINRYFTEGAYYTLRVGPTLIAPLGKNLRFTLSAGPALIYSGSVMNVLEDLTIATGEDFQKLYRKENSKLLPGYYVDANLQYQLTETAGFYVGGVYQGAGSYKQSVPSGTDANGNGLSYSSSIDFGSQEGVKGGLTVRF